MYRYCTVTVLLLYCYCTSCCNSSRYCNIISPPLSLSPSVLDHQLRNAMVNRRTGTFSMEVKKTVDRGVRLQIKMFNVPAAALWSPDSGGKSHLSRSVF